METKMGIYDERSMGLSMGQIIGVTHIKFGDRFSYHKELTYIYHVYQMFCFESSVIVLPVKVTTSSDRQYTYLLVIVSVTSCVHCSVHK